MKMCFPYNMKIISGVSVDSTNLLKILQLYNVVECAQKEIFESFPSQTWMLKDDIYAHCSFFKMTCSANTEIGDLYIHNQVINFIRGNSRKKITQKVTENPHSLMFLPSLIYFAFLCPSLSLLVLPCPFLSFLVKPHRFHTESLQINW